MRSVVHLGDEQKYTSSPKWS